MTRKYPRFLFSDPQNTKSKGPFIIHTIYPRGIFKVVLNGNKPEVEIIEFWEPDFRSDKDAQETVIPLLLDITLWLKAQMESKELIIYKDPENNILVKSGAFHK